PQPLHAQLHRIFEHRQIPDPTHRAIVNGCYRLPATRAAPLPISPWRQLQHQPALTTTLLMTPPGNLISHPATQLGNTIPIGHGRPQFVVLDTNNSAGSAVRLSLSWEKNQILATDLRG